MQVMGQHSQPLDGVVANGHAPSLVPFAISPELQVRQGGPVAAWPQQDKPDWRHHAVSAGRHMAAHRGWLAAVPVVLVNAVAFYGQLAFLRGHLAAPAGVQALVAVALESIAVYLAWQAHLAQLADDSALRLRLAAYGMAALIGAMNYSHYAAPHWRPTFAAIAFGLCSAISPWLWSIHSRRESRDALKARGLIEPHAVRLGVTRWAWHPLRSPRVMWHATWAGENDPAKAIALATTPATPEPPADAPDGDSDGDTDDEDQRQDDDRDRDEETRDERQDRDTDDDDDRDTRDHDQRQRTSAAGDKVRDILKRYPSLRRRLLEGDAATRKTAKAQVAEKAGVAVRTVERVMRELAEAGA